VVAEGDRNSGYQFEPSLAVPAYGDRNRGSGSGAPLTPRIVAALPLQPLPGGRPMDGSGAAHYHLQQQAAPGDVTGVGLGGAGWMAAEDQQAGYPCTWVPPDGGVAFSTLLDTYQDNQRDMSALLARCGRGEWVVWNQVG
jgi:hypothetical protein